MPKPNPDAEDILEHAAINLFANLGWLVTEVYHKTLGPTGSLGRDIRRSLLNKQEHWR